MKLDGRYLTTEEAAQELGVTQARIRQLVLDGTISAIKLGNQRYGVWLIAETEIERYKSIRRRRGRPTKEDKEDD